MTLTWRTPSAVTSWSLDTSGSPDLPTGHTTDDLLVALAGARYTAATTVTLPSGYTDTEGDVGGGSGGRTSHAYAVHKVDGGSESAPTFSWDVNVDPGWVAMLAAYSSNSGTGWTVESTSGSDTDVTGTDISCVGGALTWAVGDEVVINFALPDNQNLTSPALSIAGGVTHGGLTVQISQQVPVGSNDGAMYVYTATITGGGTGAPTFTGTTATNVAGGPAIFLKVTEPIGSTPATATPTAVGAVTVIPTPTIINETVITVTPGALEATTAVGDDYGSEHSVHIVMGGTSRQGTW